MILRRLRAELAAALKRAARLEGELESAAALERELSQLKRSALQASQTLVEAINSEEWWERM